MTTKQVKVINNEGMHMRPAGLIAQIAKSDPDCIVTLVTNGQEISAKSVMKLMAAGMKKGTDVEIRCVGGNEQKILGELATLLEDGFGETVD